MLKVKLELRLALQRSIRNSPLIPDDAFSYPFTRLLIDKLKELIEANTAHQEGSDRLTEEAELIADYVSSQLRSPDSVGTIDEAHELITRAEKFLAIFESA